MQEMTVYGVSFDLGSKQPIVLLRAVSGSTFLPIWIGQPEAVAILMKLQEADPPRPMTHDLALAMLDSLDAEISRVTVTELRENTFHASVTLLRDGEEVEVDSRTSDAIALALRAGARIYAADDVIDESGVEYDEAPDLENGVSPTQPFGERPPEDVDLGEFRRFLDTVSADEFRAADPEESGDEA